MANFRGIEYFEDADGSPEGSWAPDATEVTRAVRVRWADVDDFVLQALGYNLTDSYSGTRFIKRVTPMRFEEFPGFSWSGFLYAQAVRRSKPAGRVSHNEATDTANHEWMRLWITFKTLTYDIKEDDEVTVGSGPLSGTGKPDEGQSLANGVGRYVTRLWKPAQRTIILPQGVMRVVDDVTPANRLPLRTGLPKNVPHAELVYVHHLRPEPPRVSLVTCMGAVNDAIFDGWAAGTLLCLAPDQRIEQLPTGDRGYTTHFRFHWLPNVDNGGTARGHNYVYRKKAGGTLDYVLVSGDGTSSGTKAYRAADFAQLFRLDP